MHIINKIRWRVETNIIDPIVNFYLKNRFYEKSNTSHNLVYATEPQLKNLHMHHIFQCMAVSSPMNMLYQKDFDEAYTRGIKNDPINFKNKEFLRYRVYMNAAIARLSIQGGGNFCTVGVSWGIVPRTIYNYLNLENFWKSDRVYFLVDKWDQTLFGSQNNKIQQDYCGDIESIKNGFQEKNFHIIQKHAPEAFQDIKSKISYLHLNTGDKISEFKTVELLYDQLTTPGFIVIDNYHYSDSDESIDGFLKKKNNFVLPLGNSQGVVLKT